MSQEAGPHQTRGLPVSGSRPLSLRTREDKFQWLTDRQACGILLEQAEGTKAERLPYESGIAKFQSCV